MNFMEAVEALRQGRAITRRNMWSQYNHLKIVDGQLKSYLQQAYPFNYDNSIVLSNDWEVVGDDKTITFPEAVDMLRKKQKVKLKDWPKHTFLELDVGGRVLIMRRLKENDFVPDFECFCANDWEIFE